MYKILHTYYSPGELNDEINVLVKEGFKLVGPIQVSYTDPKPIFVATLWREDD